jgi:hypothetical protein
MSMNITGGVAASDPFAYNNQRANLRPGGPMQLGGKPKANPNVFSNPFG